MKATPVPNQPSSIAMIPTTFLRTFFLCISKNIPKRSLNYLFNWYSHKTLISSNCNSPLQVSDKRPFLCARINNTMGEKWIYSRTLACFWCKISENSKPKGFLVNEIGSTIYIIKDSIKYKNTSNADLPTTPGPESLRNSLS